MKKLNMQGVKILKMTHLLFTFLWVIGALTMQVVLFIAAPQTGDELFMRARILQIIDDYLIIGGANGALLTGLVYGIWTNWGFFKYRWIAFKWIMLVLQMLFGTFMLGPRLNENADIADALRDAAFIDPTFLANTAFAEVWGTVQTLLLIWVVIVSVQKPWGKKKKKE
ncbi:MAG: hypothetical protein LBN06_09110 [Prevotellaceae bacterium]|jgi:hypothetical protein|nr:hypothetical protein [Prevotellaceae bacterium]